MSRRFHCSSDTPVSRAVWPAEPKIQATSTVLSITVHVVPMVSVSQSSCTLIDAHITEKLKQRR